MPLASFRLNTLSRRMAAVVPARVASTYSNSSMVTGTGKFNTGLFTPSNFGAGTGTVTLPATLDRPWTIDFWIWIDSNNTDGSGGSAVININNQVYIQWGSTDGFRIWTSGLTLLSNLGTSGITRGGWNHFALQRAAGSNTWNIWTNGTSRGTLSNSGTASLTTFQFGKNINSGNFGSDFSTRNGFDEVRISKSLRYTAGTSFTPATSQYVNDADTVALFHCESTSQTDDPTPPGFFLRTPKTVTRSGNAQVSTAQSQFGGASALFDGSGDYLTITSANPSTDFSFGTGDFTLECWVRFTNVTVQNQAILNFRDNSFANTLSFNPNGAGKIAYTDGVAWRNTTTTIAVNTWYHVCAVRNSGVIRIYVNGTQEYSQTLTNNFGQPRGPRIGTFEDQFSFFNGYIDEVRISNTARYTSNFTVPTAPFVNDTNTLLLIHCDGANASTTFTDDNS